MADCGVALSPSSTGSHYSPIPAIPPTAADHLLIIPSSTPRGHNNSDHDQDHKKVSSKKRGRPPGSKNKPKPPVVNSKPVIAADYSFMKPGFIEISPGYDVVESIIQYGVKQGVGLCVLSACGSVSNVTLKQSTASPQTLLICPGPSTILSLSGSCVSTSNYNSSSFVISLVGAQGPGHIYGGIVGGQVVAASLVLVTVTTFSNPSFDRLPPSNNNNNVRSEAGNEGGGGGGGVDMVNTINNGNGVIPPARQMANWGPMLRSSNY